MLVLPRLAAPLPASSVRPGPPLRPPPRHSPPPPSAYTSSSWNSCTKRRHWQRVPFAHATDAPRGLGGPLPDPEERDPLLLAAIRAARLRDEESRRPESSATRKFATVKLQCPHHKIQDHLSYLILSWPRNKLIIGQDNADLCSDPLFIDPYAAVLLSLDVANQALDSPVSHLMPSADHYRLMTRYVDDKLQYLIRQSDDLRQIVLLADGMDTRPYRLSWPKMSVVYDVSPGRIFSLAAQQLRGAGAKTSRNCVVLHTPLESPYLQDRLCKNGFNGNRPSLWVLQGFPMFTSASLENLLLIVSNLAMKGSIFIGEVPYFPDWTPAADMVSEQDRLENLFFTQGFRVSIVNYENVGKAIGLDNKVNERKFIAEQYGRVLFVAEQLRFSDAQMESFRMHFERMEEDIDEEAFEEL